MDTLQAAILLKRIKSFDQLIKKRRANAKYYDEHLNESIVRPIFSNDSYDVFIPTQFKHNSRDDLKRFLELKGVETKIQHPILMPDQPAYACKDNGSYENAKKLVKKILCIPVHEKLSEMQKNYVVECVNTFSKKRVNDRSQK